MLAYLLAFYSRQAKQRRLDEQAAVREIEDLYELAPCGYHSLDADGLIVRMNQTELNWLGYTADEIIGKMDYFDLLTPSSKVVFLEKFPQFLSHGAIHDVELEVICKDGSLLPIMVSATAVRDDKSKIIMSRSTVFDMTERKRLEQQLREQATTDFLTGLNNRRQFYKLAEVELARAQRINKPLSLLLIDIDHFKELNDTYGHHSGDIALQAFSAICLRNLREIDILGRIGGEEFAVLLPETDGDIAVDVARRLCKDIASTTITLSVNTDTQITASLGVTTHISTDNTIEEMLKRADSALYMAKKNGRNQVCYIDTLSSNKTCLRS